MADRDDVCVLLPTYNEAETIESVVSGFREQGFPNVLVIDGGSTDGTRDIAESAGARVVEQTGSGKGQAVREAVAQHVDEPYVLMADGDATYRPDEADRLLKPLLSGRAAHVIGNRFANMQSGAMTRLNQFGNRIINKAFEVIHGRNLTDILSGYRAFTRESFLRSSLTAEGFGIETEMAVECVKHNISTAVVPITYQPRPDESDTNLRPFRDGATIILTLYQMAKTNNPLFYFGSVGIASTTVGLALGAFVAYDWVVNSTSHEVIAVVGSFGILLGIQLLMFGVLSDMLVAVNREQTRRLEDIAVTLSQGEEWAGDAFDDAAETEETVTESKTSSAETTVSTGTDDQR
ncbi:S-layer glycoprotein N-glycosyltransferase AglJ [Haloarcula salina]|uniref:S-layer glycoprotein N-glycosyltransferase AglJ n=1 Tax=Haloarcula salina TaxID=1429914 RepID=A0AA41KET5_9EURY|nr:S-layer glycoprotein N-glycosyltransferase AglJ [Haloarcula salina]MBV0901287.1 S-layer glycoprotein N-glycosyltransferase AglJ [Haloarcula salina]